jgi:hypothetical protein
MHSIVVHADMIVNNLAIKVSSHLLFRSKYVHVTKYVHVCCNGTKSLSQVPSLVNITTAQVHALFKQDTTQSVASTLSRPKHTV